ncbi:HNH endonuclease family protein [Nocardioides caricicola]|uniref:HNH endonuclease family protein n=1 Tax=Nocardioides caricicola TaxID=634770 RepID=A0ABW0N533_9ACTN
METGVVRRRTSLLVLAAALVASAPLAPVPATAQSDTVQLRLRAAVRQLDVAAERPDGYDRDEFKHWVDADDDCQDTRDEVLAAESRVAVTACDVTEGEWFSYYDHLTWTRSSDVDIDHMVPLKEAWDSGAHAWDDATRERYANDLGDRRSLVAVTDNENQSKSDRDPAEWLPDFEVCRYVAEWTAVKTRWDLTVDRTEKTTLRQLARDCPNRRLTVQTVTSSR